MPIGQTIRRGMKTTIVLLFITLVVAIACVPCYSEYQEATDDDRTFEGKVMAVNVAQSTLTVNDTVDIVFPISADTKLTQDINDIKLSDIEVGDYVSVSYVRSGDDSRVPAKVKNVVLEYDDSKERK